MTPGELSPGFDGTTEQTAETSADSQPNSRTTQTLSSCARSHADAEQETGGPCPEALPRSRERAKSVESPRERPAKHRRDATEDFRGLVVSYDARAGANEDYADLWQKLRAGSIRVRDSFTSTERAYLVLEQRVSEAPTAAARSWDILEQILLGRSQKVVGTELGIGPSTVAGSARGALRAAGVDARVSSVPPLLSMLVRASLERSRSHAIRSCVLELEGVSFRVLSIGLGPSSLVRQLSPAERAVALMRIEGRSLAEIAASRRTSMRTVANQLGAAFRRLGISGRSSLVEYFLTASESRRFARSSDSML